MLPIPVQVRTIFGWGAAEPVPVQVPEEVQVPEDSTNSENSTTALKHKRQRERREEKREAKRLGKAWESPHAKPLPHKVTVKLARNSR